MAKQDHGISRAEKAGIGAGIAAAAAAAALGAYFLYGKNGKENRRKVKGWMLKARGEILERLEGMENVSEETYDKVVRNVIANYKGAKNVTAAELMELAADARKHWKTIKPMFQSGKRASRKKKSGGRSSAPKSGGKSRARRSSGKAS